MKKILLLLLIFIFGTNSCGLISELSKFDLPLDQSQVTINKAGVIANEPISILTSDFETNTTDFLTKNNIKKDLIGKITLRKLEIDISSPTNANFIFLNSVEVSILADSLTETKVAWTDSLTAFDNSSLKLTLDPVDLKSYLLKDKIKLRVSVIANHSINSDYIIDIKPTFLIDLKVIGL